MKVLIFLYGIGRGLDKSEPSISKNLISSLKDQGYDTTTLYVLNNIKNIDNPRSNEKGQINPIQENIFHNAKRFDFVPAELFNEEIFQLSKAYNDGFKDGYISNRNLITQLGMLDKFSTITNGEIFERVVFCRDDLLLPSKINDWSKIFKVAENYPVVASRQWHGGIAERFYVVNFSHALITSNRLKYIHPYFSSHDSLNGEYLFKFTFDKHKIKPASLDLRLHRVRLTGINKESFILPLWRPIELIRVFFSRLRYIFN